MCMRHDGERKIRRALYKTVYKKKKKKSKRNGAEWLMSYKRTKASVEGPWSRTKSVEDKASVEGLKFCSM
jgi:hypothetical protein